MSQTHTRMWTQGRHGRIAYCGECSHEAQEWVAWPCPTVADERGEGS